jgi:DNA-binding NarL/FixJ family response regulator
MDHLQWLCAASCALGMMLLDLQSPLLARAPLERAHAIALRLASPTWTRWTAAPLAEVRALRGDSESARARLDEAAVPSALGRDALLPGDEDSPTLSQRMLALARAEVALAEGAPTVALEIANGRLAAELDSVPRLLAVRAVALARLDAVEADDALREACEAAVAHEARPLLLRIQVEKGHLLRRRRQRAEARKAFDEARSIASELAARIPDAEVRQAFERAVDEAAPPPPSPSDRQKAKSSFGGLTSRERDVARLVALGKSNRAIGRTLGIGERTVETYVSAALSKLGFSTRSQLAAWSVEHGLGDSAPKH